MEEQKAINQVLTQTRIIYLFLFLGQLLFGLGLFYSFLDAYFSVDPKDGMMLYTVPALCLVLIFIGRFLYKKRLSNILNKSLEQKLMLYQSSFLIQAVCIEIASFFSYYIFYITKNRFFLVLGLATALYFFFLQPSLKRMRKDAQI